MEKTALQVTEFNFYGDELIAVKDNSTGEIYTAINTVLRGIGFAERQIKHIHKKWSLDMIISKGVQNFVLPSSGGSQETSCISSRKLPIALTKITTTPKMKREQPELSDKLIRYQDKCADVLASVFIDGKPYDNTAIKEAITTLVQAINANTAAVLTTQEAVLALHNDFHSFVEAQNKNYFEKKQPSAWYKKMAPKYKLLMDYFGCSRKELYSNIYVELEELYDIDINQIHKDYCYSNHFCKEECYPMDAIEHNPQLRQALSLLIDDSLVKFGLVVGDNSRLKRRTLFDLAPVM